MYPLVNLNHTRRPKSYMTHAGFDSMLDDFFNTMGLESHVTKKERRPLPKANISEHTDEFIIELAVPGISKKEVEIKLEKGKLIVSHSKEKATDPEGIKFYQKGFDYGNFKRVFILPEEVDMENISANQKNGILSITLKKRSDLGPKSISIK